MSNETGSSETFGSKTGGFFLGFMAGIVIGGIAVALYAPKSGPETRNILRDEYEKTQQMLLSWSNDIKQRVDEISQILSSAGKRETQPAGNGRHRVD